MSVVLNHCAGQTLSNSFREGLGGGSAAARVAYASGVYMANAYPALARIEVFLWKLSFVCSQLREHGETTKAELFNVRTSCRTRQANRAAATSRRRLEVGIFGIMAWAWAAWAGLAGAGARHSALTRSLRGAYAELMRSVRESRLALSDSSAHFGCFFVALLVN